jgi:hypothetical protein
MVGQVHYGVPRILLVVLVVKTGVANTDPVVPVRRPAPSPRRAGSSDLLSTLQNVSFFVADAAAKKAKVIHPGKFFMFVLNLLVRSQCVLHLLRAWPYSQGMGEIEILGLSALLN